MLLGGFEGKNRKRRALLRYVARMRGISCGLRGHMVRVADSLSKG